LSGKYNYSDGFTVIIQYMSSLWSDALAENCVQMNNEQTNKDYFVGVNHRA